MNLKRQTFSMTISYIDGFIDQGTQPKSLKPISITALMMALKIQHAEGLGYNQLTSISSGFSMTSTKALSVSM